MDIPDEDPIAIEEPTVARKRARRVSFADTTAIHVFDRDEDEETPPDSKPPGTDASGGAPLCARVPMGTRGTPGENGEVGVSSLREACASEKEEVDEDDEDEAELFVKDMMDFSPGSVAGSVTSNDDENLFGPVSMSFINSRRFSEVSEENNNHDITLDSTAFSLHFRNVLPLEERSGNSVGSFKTPTGESLPDDHESFMFLTEPKKPISRSLTGEMSGNGTATSNSSHMTFVTETSRKYEYGKLSPGLEALLFKVNESIQNDETPDRSRSILPNIYGNDDKEQNESAKEFLDRNHGYISPINSMNASSARVGIPNGTVGSIAVDQFDKILHQLNAESSLPVNQTSDGIVTGINDQSSEAVMEMNDIGRMPFSISNTSLPSTPCQEAHISSDHDLEPFQCPDSKKIISKLRSISPRPSIYRVSNSEISNIQEPTFDVGLQTPLSVSMFNQQMGSPSLGSVSSLHAKRQEVQTPVTNKNIKSSYGGSVSSLHAKRQEVQTPVTNKNIKSSYGGSVSSLHAKQLETLLGSQTSSKDQQAFTLNKGIVSEVNSGTLIDATHDNLWTGGFKMNMELSNLGLLTPINVRKHAPLADYNTVAVTDASTQGFIDTMTAISSSYSKCSIPNSTCKSGLQTGEDQHSLPASQKSLSLPLAGLDVQKRKDDDLRPIDGDCINEMTRNVESTISSLNGKFGISAPCSHVVSSEARNTTSALVPSKHWKDILARVSAVISEEFSPSIGLLNLQEVDIFEEILGTLQRSQKCKSLCNDIQSTRNNLHSDYKHNQRVTEARFLQDMLLYQRVKLILLHAKRGIFQKKVDKLLVNIQECCKLKPSLLVKQSDQENVGSLKPTLTYSELKNQEDQTIILLKKELGILEEKLIRLIRFFEGFCNLKGDRSCDAFISSLNRYMDKMKCCRGVRQKLLLWKIDDLVVKKDGCAVILNYDDLLLQSFSINVLQGSVSSFRNSWIDACIEKKFPNMEAFTAFNFIFGAMIEHELADLKCFRKVTQVTYFLLSNLLEFLEEVQAVRLESTNLIRTAFCSPSAGQLGLDLYFCTSRDLNLIFDVSELKCGIYPSESSKMKIKVRSETSLPSSTLDKIMSAVQILEGGGCMMFTRLCRCISDIIRDEL